MLIENDLSCGFLVVNFYTRDGEALKIEIDGRIKILKRKGGLETTRESIFKFCTKTD